MSQENSKGTVQEREIANIEARRSYGLSTKHMYLILTKKRIFGVKLGEAVSQVLKIQTPTSVRDSDLGPINLFLSILAE